MKWQIQQATAIGGRSEQQDRIAVFDVPGSSGDQLIVLADGAGGHEDGQLASQAVVDTVCAGVADLRGTSPQRFLSELCLKAHAAIRAIGAQRATNPASTGVLLYLSGDEAYWAHVGDSRLYHFSADRLLSKTRDHTIGELLRDSGAGRTSQQAPRDNRLYMCLGGRNDVEPDVAATAIDDDDWFMLCSDGLWNQIDIDTVTGRLATAHIGADVADDLVRHAAARAGPHSDNVSIVLVTRKMSRLSMAWRALLRPRRRAAG